MRHKTVIHARHQLLLHHSSYGRLPQTAMPDDGLSASQQGRLYTSHLQNRKSFSTDTAYSVISLNAYYMLISSSINPNFASGSISWTLALLWEVKRRRTLALPDVAGGAWAFRRFVRVRAKSDNRPAIGSGSPPPRPTASA